MFQKIFCCQIKNFQFEKASKDHITKNQKVKIIDVQND